MNKQIASEINKIIEKVYQSTVDFINKHKEKITKNQPITNSEYKEWEIELNKDKVIKDFENELSVMWRRELINDNSKFNLNEAIATFNSSNFSDNLNFVIKSTRYNSEKEKRISADQGILDTKFGNVYVNYRSKAILRNFTSRYQNDIKEGIKFYVNDRSKVKSENYNNNAIPEKELFKGVVGSTNNKYLEKERNTDPFNKALRDVYNAKQNKTYGLIDDIVYGKQKYDSYKFWIKDRVNRIIETEINSAYNIGRLDKNLDKNVNVYQWKLHEGKLKPSECNLCKSLQNQIIVIDGINKDLVSKDFRKYKTKEPLVVSYLLNNEYFPPLHPYCECYLLPIKDKNELDKLIKKFYKYNLNPDMVKRAYASFDDNNSNNMLNSLINTITTSALTSGVVYHGIQNGYIEEYYKRYIKQENKEKEEFQRGVAMATIGVTGGIALLVYLLSKYNPNAINKVTTISKKVNNEINEALEENNIRKTDIIDTVRDIVITNQIKNIKPNDIKEQIQENEEQKNNVIKEKIQENELKKKENNYIKKIDNEYRKLSDIEDLILFLREKINEINYRLKRLRLITDKDKALKEAKELKRLYQVTLRSRIDSYGKTSQLSLKRKAKNIYKIENTINQLISNYKKDFDNIVIVKEYMGNSYVINESESLRSIIELIKLQVNEIINSYNNIQLQEGELSSNLQTDGINVGYLGNWRINIDPMSFDIIAKDNNINNYLRKKYKESK